jgi:hypothetical protein
MDACFVCHWWLPWCCVGPGVGQGVGWEFPCISAWSCELFHNVAMLHGVHRKVFEAAGAYCSAPALVLAHLPLCFSKTAKDGCCCCCCCPCVAAGVVCGAAASGNYVWNDPTVSPRVCVCVREGSACTRVCSLGSVCVRGGDILP